MKKRDFLYYIQKTKKYNEDNDCSVIAHSVITGLSYEESHYVLRHIGGRTHKSAPLSWNAFYDCFEQLGYTLEPIDFEGKTYTTLTVPEEGQYLIETYNKSSSHVSGTNQGQIVDWCRNSKIRVKEMMKVVKTQESTFKPKRYVSTQL